MSDWLGVDVDRSSAPVLPLAAIDQRVVTRDNLMEARSRHALALLGQMPSRRRWSDHDPGEREAGTRQHGQQHRTALRSRR